MNDQFNNTLMEKIKGLSENKAKWALRTLVLSSFISNDNLEAIIDSAAISIADDVRIVS